jgi:5-bromo-4-chloroindolyl phosphate hydrolysis protein
MGRHKTSIENKVENQNYRFSRHGNLNENEKNELNEMEQKLSAEIEDLENRIKATDDLKSLKTLSTMLDQKRRLFYALSKRPKRDTETEKQEKLLGELMGYGK